MRMNIKPRFNHSKWRLGFIFVMYLFIVMIVNHITWVDIQVRRLGAQKEPSESGKLYSDQSFFC